MFQFRQIGLIELGSSNVIGSRSRIRGVEVELKVCMFVVPRDLYYYRTDVVLLYFLLFLMIVIIDTEITIGLGRFRVLVVVIGVSSYV